MRSLLCTLLVAGLALLAVPAPSRPQQAPHVVPTDPLKPADEVKQFRLPEGFEAQLVAAEPDIAKPMNIAFDDQGRLWVTDTLEYPFPAKPGVKARDTVKVLEDFGPDGRARKITTFADGLNIPIGLLPLPVGKTREALVYGIPEVLRLTDTKGNGVADRRERAYGTYGFRDTHGMTSGFTLGLDGWVYACHGFANQSAVKARDGGEVKMQSGNTYRFRPDGSRVQQWTWGQVNPFGLSLDPWGYLYSADCHSQPIYQLIRGGFYPSFGKPHDGLGFAPEMITDYRGSTAVCGVAYYAADAYPKRYRGQAFVGDVMTNQIVEFQLSWEGTTPKATQRVFLDSKDQWFRPVDIKLGPDGALYVADFYNRIIGHYEVPLTHPRRDRHRGRIWRIVYTGKGHKGTPAPRQDFAKATDKDLVADLAHPNFAVRMTATNQLATRGPKVAKAVREAVGSFAPRTEAKEWQAAQGLWVVERVGGLTEEEMKQAAGSGSALVRAHAMRALGEREKLTDAGRKLVRAGLDDANVHVQRAAADAAGRHPHADNIKALLTLRHKVPAADTHLTHVVRIALRNQLLEDGAWKGLAAGQAEAKDARAIADVAPGVRSAASASFLFGYVKQHGGALEQLAPQVQHIARYAAKEDLKPLVDWAKEDAVKSLGHQAGLFRAVERGLGERGTGLTESAKEWAEALTGRLLDSSRPEEVREGIELTELARVGSRLAKLLTMAGDGKANVGVRQAAVSALLSFDARKHAVAVGKVLTDAGAPFAVREHAANQLARANQGETRAVLVAAMPTAPARLQNSIAAAMAGSREGAEALLTAIAGGKASARVLQEQAVVLRLQATRVPGLKERLTKLTAGLPTADAKLQGLIAARRKGYATAKPDVKRGAEVFTKHCAICHQVGGKGAKVGPQLDGIGLRGLDRLLEDTLDPNRNIDEAFRTTSLTLGSGKTVQGLLLREQGAELVLADAQGKEVRVAKKDVDERAVSPLSPMPANVGEQVSEKDFYDLVAYLLSLRPGGK